MKRTCENLKSAGNGRNGSESSNGVNSKHEVLEALVRDYGDRAYQFAYRLCGNADAAKDLVQESFYRVMKSWHRYDAARPLDAWFFTILRNVYLDARKRCERVRTVSLDAPVNGSADGESYCTLLPDGGTGLLERLERSERASSVMRELGKLSSEHRTVLILRDMKGLSYAEIAVVLRLSEGTIRSRISRAREAFRRRSVPLGMAVY